MFSDVTHISVCLSTPVRYESPLHWPLHPNQQNICPSCKGLAACAEVIWGTQGGCPTHEQNALPSFAVLPSYRTCKLLSSKDPQQVASQKAGRCSTYRGSHINCTSALQFISVLLCRSAPELTFKKRNREPKPPPHTLGYPGPLLHQECYKQLFAMQSLQGSAFWAVLLHKRYRCLKTRATYTRTHYKLKIAPCIALTRLSRGHSCMHSVNPAGERKSQRSAVQLASTQPAQAGGRSGVLPPTAASGHLQEFPLLLLQVAEEIHYPSLKEFFSNLLLFWLAPTARGLWEFGSSREFASCTSLAEPIQPSKSHNNPSFPHNLFSQTFSHLKALLGPLQMFITLLRHPAMVLPECLPNVWLLKKHGCL